MKLIKVECLPPYKTRSALYKIAQKGLKTAIVVGCPNYDPFGVRSAYDCLCQFVQINNLDWSIERMAFGKDDENGFFFCFPESIDIMLKECQIVDWS